MVRTDQHILQGRIQMHYYFFKAYLFIRKHKFLSLLSVVILLGFLVRNAGRIHFEEDITRIIPRNEQTDLTAKVLQQLNFSDKITVIIDIEDSSGAAERMASDFMGSLDIPGRLIRSAQGMMDQEQVEGLFDFVYQHLPIYLEADDYQLLDSINKPAAIQVKLDQNLRSVLSPSGMVTSSFISKDPLGWTELAFKHLQEAQSGNNFHIKNGYFYTEDGSKILLFLDPVYAGAETEHNKILVQQLNDLADSLNAIYKGKSSVSYYGASFIAVANADQIQRDIMKTVLISMSALMLILILYYRSWRIPLILFLPTLLGTGLALTFLYYYKSHISAISLSIGAVLLGITIDYALHILTHARHKLSTGELFREMTRPLMMSAATTAVTFLCLLFLHSEALKDLGIFAFISILFSGIFSLILIPQFYSAKEAAALDKTNFIDRMAAYPFDRQKWLQLFSVLLVVVSLFTFHVKFNGDLSTLNYVPPDQLKAEQKLDHIMGSDLRSLYIVQYGHDVDQLIASNEQLNDSLLLQKASGSIVSFNSMSSVLMSREIQEQRWKRWQEYWAARDKEHFIHTITALGAICGFNPSAFEQIAALLGKKPEVLGLEDYRKIPGLLLDEFVNEENGLYTISSIVKVNAEERDEYVRSLEQGKKSNQLVIDRKQMNETFLGELVGDFAQLVNYSVVVILLILWFFFRRLEMVLVAFIPIALTGLVTAGMMGLLGIEFNIFSAIVCSLVFSHGVDFTIFMTSALQQKMTRGKMEVSYRSSIILAALTTLLAIGALIFAQHPALRSIASVSLIGVLAALLMTFVLYPVIFEWVFIHRQSRGFTPVTIPRLIFSIWSFGYFFFGNLWLVFMLRYKLFFGIKDKGRQVRKENERMAGFLRSVYNSHPMAPITSRRLDEDIDKRPVIYIANHSSFLDTLILGFLSRPAVMMVNKWVYHSRIFGIAIRYAGYISTTQDLEKNLENCRQRVAEGYSILIFPEGTRSRSNEQLRFRNGAFYLAKELSLDIVPVFIHGNAELLPKNDFFINFHPAQVIEGSRIPIQPFLEEDARSIQKTVSREYKSQYREIRNEREGPAYFREKLWLSYLYKEQYVYSAARKCLEHELNIYFDIFHKIRMKKHLLILKDDYGLTGFYFKLNLHRLDIQVYQEEEGYEDIIQNNFLFLQYPLRTLPGLQKKPHIIPDVLILTVPYLAYLEILDAAMVIVLHPKGEIPDTVPGMNVQFTSGFYTIFEKQ